MELRRKELIRDIDLCILKLKCLKVDCTKNARNGEYNKSEIFRVRREINKTLIKFELNQN